MDLPLLSAEFVGLALTLYVMLDGFDLGVGILLLAQPNTAFRDHMIDSITPTWDGNETWLVMTGITLFTAFPIAYGILLPAFYLPVVVMLLSLGIRGVSFEFRVQMKKYQYRWDFAFGLASLVAAFMQGVVLGGLFQGITVRHLQFSGSVFDIFRPLALLSGAGLVVGYAVLGAGWLYLKAIGEIATFAMTSIRIAVPSFLVITGAACICAAMIQPGIRLAWALHPIALSVIAILVIFLGLSLSVLPRPERAATPFILGLTIFLLGMAGFAIIVFPAIIPFELSLWEAASSPSSQVFLLIGALLVTPVILAYSAFAYWVFRGKTPQGGWTE
jgi:cytochrome bd ubiquinol oxidase subunit II